MLIVALVLAVIGLAALVAAVVTGNEAMAWVCIGASSLGVLLLVVDAIRERAQRRSAGSRLLLADDTEVLAEVADDTEVIEPAGMTERATEVIETEITETEIIDPAGVDAEIGLETDLGIAAEDYPDDVVHDEPDFDIPSDDEPDVPQSAEEAALHVVDEAHIDDEYVEDGDIDEEYLGDTAGDTAGEAAGAEALDMPPVDVEDRERDRD